MLARSLRRERLADTRRPEQIEHQPVALAVNEVIETCVGSMRVDERLQQHLAILGQHEILKCLVIPIDRLDVLNVELDCDMS